MFCYQCQETIKNQGCTIKGFCGKPEETADLQDLLIYVCKGIAVYAEKLNAVDKKVGRYVCEALFTTITNVAWEDSSIITKIEDGLKIRDDVKAKAGSAADGNLPDCATWTPRNREEMKTKALSGEVRINAASNEDVASLRSLLIFGIKGIAAYAEHAAVLGYEKDDIYKFLIEALASTTKDLSVEAMIALVMKAGEMAVNTMALLDEANTKTYGNPEITEVNIGVRNNYPAFKKYSHFVGNYGSSWWHQNEDFETFNGPIILTTNCLIPVKKENTYLGRLFTTSVVNYPGAKHIAGRPAGGSKDFSAVIELAKTCKPPQQIETGKIVGGFAHNQVLALADKVVAAVKSGAIKRFVVMAGCDGRQKPRGYFTEVAEALPKDTVILTAGCAKYRYNKLPLGDIGGIPRVLDAGQCNDCYSLAVIALKLKDVFELKDINELPISFDIAWYEQKAVAVLLALLYLNVKGIRLGPTLPAFLSPAVAKVLVEKFDIKPIGAVNEDVAAMMKGQ